MSSSSDSSDDESREPLDTLIGRLETHDYDGHVNLAKRAREDGELDQLRVIRTKFAAAFPLTESIWLEWISDEIKLDDVDVGALFEQGVEDYHAPKLWLEYIQWAIKWLGAENGLARFRALCERAISCVGLDPESGAAIWEAYRETEKMIESDEQKEIITKLYRRQCSLPIYQNDETYKEFKQYNQEAWKQTKQAYDKATLKTKEIEPFEAATRTAESPADLLVAWKGYIGHELKKDDPVRIEFLYERACTKLCLNPALWKEYIDWQLKMNSPQLMRTARRACRNCTWESGLWSTYLKVAERKEPEKLDQIKDAAVKAVLVGSAAQVGEIVDLLRTYILACSRLCLVDEDGDIEQFREASRKTIKYIEYDLGNQYGDEVASEEKVWFEIHSTRVEAAKGDLTRARSKWNKLLSTTNGRLAQNWVMAARLEIDYGDKQKAIELMIKGLRFASHNLEQLYAEARYYAEIYASAEKFDEIERLINQKMSDLERKEARTALEKDRGVKRAKKDKEKVEGKTKKTGFKPMAFVKQVEGGVETPPRKKQRRNEKAEEPMETGPSQAPVDPFKMPTLPMAEPKAPTPAKKAKKEPTKEEKETIQETESKHAETDEEKSRTIFISNLSYQLFQPEKKVRDLLLGCGEIEGMRLIKKGALFRGYAYVTFKEKVGADNALLRDRNQVEKRPAFITRYVDKDSGEKKKDFKFHDGKEDHRVFAKGFNVDISREEIDVIFGKIGTIVDVRLPETRQGHRKPFFYVEFSTSFEATKSNLKLHDQLIDGNRVEVLVSNPPKRGGEREKEKKEIDISKTAYATPKSKFNLVPRMVPSAVTKKPLMKKQEITEQKVEKEKTQEATSGLSNADFRAKFLN